MINLITLFLLSVFFFYSQVSAQFSSTLLGKVVEEATKEPIPGVSVSIVGTNLGTSTDIEGNFRIGNLEIGVYQLRFSAVGFSTVIKTDIMVNASKPTEVLVNLTQTDIELEGVTVKANFFEFDPSNTGSVSNLSYEEIRRAPGGFEDVIRALSLLPGVAQASAGRNDLVVRGGAPSENLYIVDGFVVPNINHFGTQGATGGPISYVNLDFVREATFSTGGFSSLYGDKISSVLNIDLRDGRSDKFGGKATISATQFGLNIEGPIAGKGNYIFSARRSYLDFIFKAAGFNFIPEYYDALAKITYNFDSKNKLSYLFIGAFDNVNFNNNTAKNRYNNSRILGSDQTSYITGISFRHLFPKGFFDLVLSRNFTDYNSSQKDTLLNPIFLNDSKEGENELKGDLIYKTSPSEEINVGLSLKQIKFRADLILPNFYTSFGEIINIPNLKSEESYTKAGMYVNYSNLLFNRVRIGVGIRGDYFSGINDKLSISPRFSIVYYLNDLANLFFNCGYYYQTPSYIWLIADESNKNLKSIRANQFILGYERKLKEDVRIKLEGYLKIYNDYPASVNRPYLILSNTGAGYGGADENFASYGLEQLTSGGKGNAYGVEFSLQKKLSEVPLYGLLSVTYNQSNFTVIDNVKRPGSFDQRWIINLSAGYMFSKNWEGSVKFRFASGNPYTPFNESGMQNVKDYNSVRYKSTHSLDFRIDRRWNFEKWNLITYIDIQNVYNNKNSNSVRWNYLEKKADFQSSIGILPSIGINAEF